MFDADRKMRLACTVADGAIEGPNSMHFTQHERECHGPGVPANDGPQL